MYILRGKSFISNFLIMSSSLTTPAVIFFITALLGIPSQSEVEAGDSPILGYYLQLYNSINSYRAKHTIPALRWNRTLTESAEYFAARILHSPYSFDVDEAEGLTFFVTPGTIRPSAAFVTGTWYNESVHYNFNNPGYNAACLNFTQMLWRSSTSIGIGSYTHNGIPHNYTSVVAKFYPSGNIRGKYRFNVVPKYQKL